jgi:hypothetical protein
MASLTMVLAVEVLGVGREGGPCRVFDALVDGEDRDVAGAAQAAVVEDGLQAAEHARVAVGDGPDALHEVGAGEMEQLLGHGLAAVLEQVSGVGT